MDNRPIEQWSSRWLVLALGLLGLAAAAALTWSLFERLTLHARSEEVAREFAVDATARAAQQIDAAAVRARGSALGLAARLTAGTLDPAAAPEELTKNILENPEIYGGTVTFRPYGYSSDKRLHAPYCLRQGKGVTCKQLEVDYDYTDRSCDWYNLAMSSGATWTEPYLCESGKEYMATFSAPFRLPRETGVGPTGVVTMDLTAGELGRIARSVDLGRGGFAALTSRDGRYLYHPDSRFVEGRMTIAQAAEELHDPDREVLGRWARAGESGAFKHVSTTAGKDSWLAVEPIPDTGWSLQATYLLEEFRPDARTVRRRTVDAVLSGLALLGLIAAVAVVRRRSVAALWSLSGGLSGATVVGIGLIWHAALTSSPAAGAGGTPVADTVGAASAAAAILDAARREGRAPPELVPTGVYLQTVEFQDNRDLRVSGYVWQKYASDRPRAWEPGVTFPDGLEMKIESAYSLENRGETVTGWRFEGTLREEFGYASFPLDEEAVWLRLWPARISDRVALVPDLESYSLTSATTLPGLATDLVLPGWDAQEAKFEIKGDTYRTDFGLGRGEARRGIPDLFYTVSIQRNFFDAFVSHLTPLMVVAIMLFSVLLSLSRNPERVSLLGSQTTTILSFAAALFFVVVFGHIDLRQKLGAESVFYLEYFYLVMYAAILAVSIIAIRFALGDGKGWLQERDGLAPKLLFFPLLTSALLGVTLYFFY